MERLEDTIKKNIQICSHIQHKYGLKEITPVILDIMITENNLNNTKYSYEDVKKMAVAIVNNKYLTQYGAKRK